MDSAVAKFQKALELNPELKLDPDTKAKQLAAPTLLKEGEKLAQQGNIEKAIAYYDKAIEFKPDFHEAWYNRGVALNKLERYTEAIASYDKVIEIKPDDHEAWYKRGQALYKLKQYSDAIAILLKAIYLLQKSKIVRLNWFKGEGGRGKGNKKEVIRLNNDHRLNI